VIDIESILQKFNPVSLNDIDKHKLFDRVDFKYVFPLDQLPEILESLNERYDLLLTNKNGLNTYVSHYFDTGNFQMYLNHHNGLKNRSKVRFRQYLDTNTAFFEIKQKTNKERTIKSRIEINNKKIAFTPQIAEMLLNKTGLNTNMLSEVLIVKYHRISLISKSSKERLSIDIDLHYNRFGKIITYPNIVIAEIKQQKFSDSYFRNLMHSHNIPSVNISKYCLGMAVLNPDLKSNNFKSKILYVSKLSKKSN